MSNTVIIDADELDRFAGALQRFSRDLQDGMHSLAGEFHRLGETWRDPEYVRFQDELEQTVLFLQRFNQAADQYVPHLRHTAQRTREVHRR